MSSEPGKIALITGAGSGIGRATARKLFRHGYCVVLAGRSKAPLEALADEAQQLGHKALAVPTDVTDAASVAALFDAIRQRYNRLDLLFNNAGRGAPAVDIDELSLDDWHAVVDTNLTGAFLCTRAAIRIDEDADCRAADASSTTARSRHTHRVRTVRLYRHQARDDRPHQVDFARRTQVRHRLRTDRHRQCAHGTGGTHGKGSATGQRRIAVEPLMDVEHVRRRGPLHGESAARRQRAVHDHYGDQDAVCRAWVAKRQRLRAPGAATRQVDVRQYPRMGGVGSISLKPSREHPACK